eukprot:TRINITY_DN41565_c0_g1_i1.p1 TRINITY_DN41565_c0_g1~~TRINITY_DN41565_c0_g1_i1.p1  ORF type:complete len:228 (-),score=34.11 TRINITY_DN41565_c0_g1_i1:121-804(-)
MDRILPTAGTSTGRLDLGVYPWPEPGAGLWWPAESRPAPGCWSTAKTGVRLGKACDDLRSIAEPPGLPPPGFDDPSPSDGEEGQTPKERIPAAAERLSAANWLNGSHSESLSFSSTHNILETSRDISRGGGSGASFQSSQRENILLQVSDDMREAHAKQTCNPCAYFVKKADGCRKGAECTFCHLCTEEDVRNKRRQLNKLMRRKQRRDDKQAGTFYYAGDMPNPFQ